MWFTKSAYAVGASCLGIDWRNQRRKDRHQQQNQHNGESDLRQTVAL
jgi:hypothetical protein